MAQNSFFSQQPPPEQPAMPDMGGINRRLKLIEEQLETVRKKQQMSENNMLEQQKNQNATIRAYGDELDQMKGAIEDIKKDVKLIIKELQMGAKAEDVKVLQKYIDMWDPVKFATPSSVERIVRDAINKHLNDDNGRLSN